MVCQRLIPFIQIHRMIVDSLANFTRVSDQCDVVGQLSNPVSVLGLAHDFHSVVHADPNLSETENGATGFAMQIDVKRDVDQATDVPEAAQLFFDVCPGAKLRNRSKDVALQNEYGAADQDTDSRQTGKNCCSHLFISLFEGKLILGFGRDGPTSLGEYLGSSILETISPGGYGIVFRAVMGHLKIL